MNQEDRLRIDGVEAKLQEANAGIIRIEKALVGDKEMGQPGLISRVQDLEGTAKKIENARWYVLGAIAVVTIIGGAAAYIIDTYIKLKG